MTSKKYPKHYIATANEWIPHKVKMEWQCCDCGLVHDVEFELEMLNVRMRRNEAETKKVRKEKLK